MEGKRERERTSEHTVARESRAKKGWTVREKEEERGSRESLDERCPRDRHQV